MTQFTYDGDGRRVKSVITTNIGSTTTFFVGSHYEVTHSTGSGQAGTSITKYYGVYPAGGGAGTQRIAMRKDGALYYLIGDHLGSTSLVTDAAGTVISETRYKAWGEVRHQSGVTPTEYGFTGQYSHAADFGLMFYNARWYDVSLGRFAQADTIVPPGSQGLDRYAYANNNPIRFIDPSGHVSCSSVAEDDCSFETMTQEEVVKRNIKSKFGVEMSDKGAKAWTIDNLRLTLSSLNNINNALNGNLKSLSQGWTFLMQNQQGGGSYHGVTSTDGTMTIDFYTISNDIMRQMNIYHEVGHLIDNVPGMENIFTRGMAGRVWEDVDGTYLFGGENAGSINTGLTLINPDRVYDPNYVTAEAIQHAGGDPSEQWADMFANYVAGNIDTSESPGQTMHAVVETLLFSRGINH